jgi:hypothetical protein
MASMARRRCIGPDSIETQFRLAQPRLGDYHAGVMNVTVHVGWNFVADVWGKHAPTRSGAARSRSRRPWR